MPTLTKNPEKNEFRFLQFRVPSDLRKALRQFALDREISVQEACTRAIRALVDGQAA